jgi:hypothetical protein
MDGFFLCVGNIQAEKTHRQNTAKLIKRQHKIMEKTKNKNCKFHRGTNNKE